MVLKKFDKAQSRLIDLLCLKILVIDGPDYCYDIYKKLKKGILPHALERKRMEPFKLYNNRVGRSLDRLEKQGFIEKEKQQRKSKKGPPRIFCHTTFHGLLHILEFHKESWGYINEIARKHVDKLPLIFGEWEYFGKKGVKDKVIEAMKAFCKTYVPYAYTSGRFERTNELFLREDMTRAILYFHLNLITLPPLNKASEQVRQQIFEREKMKTFEWVRIWLENRKLEQYLTRELDEDEREHEERLRNIRLVKEYIRSLKGISG